MIIKNSYIWNNVEIHDNCVIENSIICDNVVLQKGTKVGSGSLLSYCIETKENAIIPERSMISRYTYDSDKMAFIEAKNQGND